MDRWLFQSGTEVAGTLLVGVLAYAGLVIILRATGKRTLSKMNAFDLVVTVALGSILSTVILNDSVSLVRGLSALALLALLQLAITWLSARHAWVRRLVTGEPTLLLFRGTLLREAMRKARVTEDEVFAALRASGLRGLDAAKAVVLETDGSITVVESGPRAGDSTLAGLEPPEPHGP